MFIILAISIRPLIHWHNVNANTYIIMLEFEYAKQFVDQFSESEKENENKSEKVQTARENRSMFESEHSCARQRGM